MSRFKIVFLMKRRQIIFMIVTDNDRVIRYLVLYNSLNLRLALYSALRASIPACLLLVVGFKCSLFARNLREILALSQDLLNLRNSCSKGTLSLTFIEVKTLYSSSLLKGGLSLKIIIASNIYKRPSKAKNFTIKKPYVKSDIKKGLFGT